MDHGRFGWIDEQPWVEDTLMRMSSPFIADTEWYYWESRASMGHVDIIPWELEEKALGAAQRPHYQRRGTCVAQAFSRAVELTMLADMVIHGEGEEWVAQVHPGSIYGISRVEVGGGRLRGDGSLGAWAAKGVVQYGVLFRRKYPAYDLSGADDETFAVDWGARGVPDELEPIMREHPVGDASMVLNGEQYKVAAYAWKPVPICSMQAFRTQRDSYGMCAPNPRDTWAHCMLAAGLLQIKHPQHPNGRYVVPIAQSWGPNNPSGNTRVVLQTGREITLPPGWFLVDIEVLDRNILPRRDSFALAGVKGWVPQPERERQLIIPA